MSASARLTILAIVLGTPAAVGWSIVIRAIWDHTFGVPDDASVQVGPVIAATLFVGIFAMLLTLGAYQALYEARRRRDDRAVATWPDPPDLLSWFSKDPQPRLCSSLGSPSQ